MIKLRNVRTDRPDKDGIYMVTEKSTGKISFFEYKRGSGMGGWNYCPSFAHVKINDTLWVDLSEVQPSPYNFNTIRVPGSWRDEKIRDEIEKAASANGWPSKKRNNMENLEEVYRQRSKEAEAIVLDLRDAILKVLVKHEICPMHWLKDGCPVEVYGTKSEVGSQFEKEYKRVLRQNIELRNKVRELEKK